jgi:hypothetical protein
MIRTFLWLPLASAAALTTACSTFDDGPYAYGQGWRRAQVLEVSDGRSAPALGGKDCRSAQPANASSARYAVMSYSYGGNPNTRAKRIVPVQDGIALGVGSWAYINVLDCAQPLKKWGLERG